MPTQEQLSESMKKAAGALRDADVPFILAGSMACWARGGPVSQHDVDFMVKPEDAERAIKALGEAGMRTERPPEGWLYKAWDGDILVDLIWAPSGMEITDEVFARADELNVYAVSMRVMRLEDVIVTKLAALREHELHYGRILEISRSLRELIDWDHVRREAPDNPYVRAFFTMIEGLGIAPAVTAEDVPAATA